MNDPLCPVVFSFRPWIGAPTRWLAETFRGTFATECRVCGLRRESSYTVGRIPRICPDCVGWAERQGVTVTWSFDGYGEKVRDVRAHV